ncbi:Fcf1-domain-containing protein [Xylariaceae sp. FL0255]|nr:Fcf1-domain-containing protein [Xylariaceae sp. FL0255]
MPRAKRSKQYRKLMSHYVMNFGFREPYQVLCDSQFLEAAVQSKMDVDHILKATLHGTTKLQVTQCSIRHLYARNKEPGVAAAIDFAKTLERRRCGHLPADYPEPLSELECLHSVVDPKQTGVNKHHVCSAINDDEVRASIRNSVTAVPLLYIRRSVLIMEPASSATMKARSRDEKSKFRSELKSTGAKRKREEDDDTGDEDGGTGKTTAAEEPQKKKKKKLFGRKEPNPLSMKKKKDKPNPKPAAAVEEPVSSKHTDHDDDNRDQIANAEDRPAQKRRRKHKSKRIDVPGETTDEGTNAMEAPSGGE